MDERLTKEVDEMNEIFHRHQAEILLEAEKKIFRQLFKEFGMALPRVVDVSKVIRAIRSVLEPDERH
jgi:hypothetical protein